MTTVTDFLDQHHINTSTDQHQQLVQIVHAVSRIPWGEARTVESVLQCHKGTCTGKHLLLQACFDELNIVYQPVVCTFRWGDKPLALPAHLQAILDEGEWEHGHNFVRVRDQTGAWIDVDITWDEPLIEYGFPCLPSTWDGTTSFIGVEPLERWNNVDVAVKKKELIASLSPELRARRSRFLRSFIEWIASLR